MATEQNLFTAIILAADREAANPVAESAGVSCKSLAPINNIPMIFRVLDALSLSSWIGNKILCGPPADIIDKEPELKNHITSSGTKWIANQATPSLSAYEAMKSVPQDNCILLTTSDHALLTPQIVNYFCREAQETKCDVIVALALHETVMTAYPQTSRTAYRFTDGSYCSCNLFAFLTPQSRTVPSFWRRVEQQRKRPWRTISTLGWTTVFRYLTGNLSLSDAVDRISHRLGYKIATVILPYPEAAIDVDSAEDLRLVEKIAENRS